MKPDDLKDLSGELELIKKKYANQKKTGEKVRDGDYDSAMKGEDFRRYVKSLIIKPNVSWNDIAGLSDAKNTINESYLISIMKNKPEAIEPCNSILFHGPPGTGKTLLAAATASTLNAKFFNVKIGDMLSKYFGESSKIISALYNVAREMAPSVIFLDEFDSIGGIRDDKTEASRRVLSSLLAEIDGLHNKKSSQNVLTMAATNTPWDLDIAMLSRFEMKIYVPLPDEQAVMEMIKLNTREIELDVDIQKIAQKCVSKLFSGRNVAFLCREAIKNMVRNQNNFDKIGNLPLDAIIDYRLETRPLTKSDFRKSFSKIKSTVRVSDVIEHEDWAIKNGSDSYDGFAKDEHICVINESEIHRKVQSEKVSERKEAAYEMGKNFKAFTDREKATKDLLNLVKDENWKVRREAAKAIGSAFIYLTDGERATNELFALTNDEDWRVRSVLAEAISSAFKYFCNRDRATNNLLILTKHENWKVRSVMAEAIGSAFNNLTNKDRATEALLTLAKDNDSFVRRIAGKAIGSAFNNLTNKDHATEALLALAKDNDIFVQRNAAEAIGSAFSQFTDKVRVWNELLNLIKHDDRFVLIGVAYALGSAFPHVTDKDQATEALLGLINDKDTDVRSVAAETLGSVFPYIADNDWVIEKLLSLTKDKKSIVRAYASHSLGRAYVFKATESKNEENFRKELESALQFFEKSSREEINSQPARFCLPFYRSFYMLTFRKEGAKGEVQKYLEEAKSAVEDSYSREKLLEAVKNLGNALKEVQNLKEKDFNHLKRDLNAYRKYCDRVAEMLDEVEKKAPSAVGVLWKGLPIINQDIWIGNQINAKGDENNI